VAHGPAPSSPLDSSIRYSSGDEAPALATDPYVAFVAAQEMMAPELARGPYVTFLEA